MFGQERQHQTLGGLMPVLDLLTNAYASRTGKRELPWDDIPSGSETDNDNGKDDQ